MVTLQPGQVREIHIDGDEIGDFYAVRPLRDFLRDWSELGGFNIGDWINVPRAYIGVVHADGAYLIKAGPGTRAAQLVAQQDALLGGPHNV